MLELPSRHAAHDPVPVMSVVRVPAVAACAAAVIVAAATMSMLEPILAIHLQTLGVNPGRIGLVFGIAAASSALLHPLSGGLADRVGARRVTMWGLTASGCVLPI